MTRAWWIIGCGYTGTQLARALVARPEVAGEVVITRRDGEVARALGAALGVRGERLDLADPAVGDPAAGDPAHAAPSAVAAIPPGAIVVSTAPPGADPAAEIRTLLRLGRGAARLVYVSSTGVYGPGDGAWVDETWPIAPITGSGRARAAAEAALADAPMPWVALRAAGIYGPGRGLVDRIRAGSYRVIGDGTSHVGRIHVVDLVAAIIAAGTGTATGAINAADDDPAPIGAVADAVAARLGLPPPPRVPASAVPPEVAGMLTANRRIANRRLRDELGVALRYPSWRDALAVEVAAAPPAPA
jgi:nucleoside-diphosphate-sugar epimerase